MMCALEVDKRLDLAKQLLALVNEHGLECGQDECLLLDGVVRDCAYRIQAAVRLWRQEVEAGRACKSNGFSDQGRGGPAGSAHHPGVLFTLNGRAK